MRTAWPQFNSQAFLGDLSERPKAISLFNRADQIAHALRRRLPDAFPRTAKILIRALPDARNESGYGPMENFRLLPFSRLVGLYGLDDFDSAMGALYEITRRFTSEFDLRPFLVKYPEQVLSVLRCWRDDNDFHVRRLVSEGTRTRLPWCAHLRAFQDDPAPVIELITPMRRDPTRYVRMSVANNLADIIKDDFEIGLQVVETWLADADPYTLWVVRHAVRYHVKTKGIQPENLVTELRRSRRSPTTRQGSLALV